MADNPPLIVSPATCCWCGSHLVRHDTTPWVCPTPACQTRQLHWGLRTRKGRAKPTDPWTWVYVPTPKGVSFYEQTRKTRRTLFGGAAGGAKSHTIRWGLYRDALRLPGIQCLLLRRTYKDLEKNHLAAMMREVPLLGGTYLDSKKMAKFDNGSVIYAGHCETDADALAYLSSEFDRIAFDELVTFDRDPALEIMTRARTSHPKVLADGGAQVWAGTNPGGTGALWVKQFFIDKVVDRDEFPRYNPDLYGFVPAFLSDNPWIDPDYEEDLDEQSEMRRRQLKFGDWNAFVGQFFSQWHEEKDGRPWHVRTVQIAPETEHFCSMDWGYSSPGVVLWWACLPDGHYHIRAEYKFREMSAEAVAEAILVKTREMGIGRLRYVVCDPAMKAKTGSGRGESIFETLSRYGLPMRPGDNDRFNGWARCRDLLRPAPDGTPWLTVDVDCVYGRRTVPAMVQDPKDPEDVDTTKDDHWCLLGGTEITTDRGPVALWAVQPGLDRVWTRGGWRRVVRAGRTGHSTIIYEVKLSTRRTLYATGNHPVWVEGRGFISVDALRYGDTLSPCPIIPASDEMPAPSGASTMDRFQSAMRSITETAIPAITRSTTWNAWSDSLIAARMREGGRWLRTIWRKCMKALDGGISPRLGVPGIGSTVVASGTNASGRNGVVTSVAGPTLIGLHLGEVASVPITVNQHGDALQALILWRARASSVPPSSAWISTAQPKPVLSLAPTVVGVRRRELETPVPVYNLTVEGDHEYYAENILTHNCDAWRYGAMSRPSPTRHRTPRDEDAPVNSWAWWRAYHRRQERQTGVLA